MNVAITKLLIVVSIIVLIGAITVMYSSIIFSIRGSIDYVKTLQLIRDKSVLSVSSGTEIIPSINFKNTDTRIAFYDVPAHLAVAIPDIKFPWIENGSLVEKELVVYELDMDYNMLCVEDINTDYSSDIIPLQVLDEGEEVPLYYEIYNTSSDNLCLIPIVNIKRGEDGSGNIIVKINIPIIKSVSINGRNVSNGVAILDSIYNIVMNSVEKSITTIPYEYEYYGDIVSDLNVTLELEEPFGNASLFEVNIGKVEPNVTIYFYVNIIETKISFEGK